MRRHLRKLLPDPDGVCAGRWLAPWAGRLLQPQLLRLNRRSVAGGFAAGLFCGLIPGPFQMLGAALCCLVWRLNLPIAVLTTLYTNPFTILPLYFLAFLIGNFLLNGAAPFVPPPEWPGGALRVELLPFVHDLLAWVQGLGAPLALGLLVMASAFAALGYAAVQLAWRLWLLRVRRERQRRQHINIG